MVFKFDYSTYKWVISVIYLLTSFFYKQVYKNRKYPNYKIVKASHNSNMEQLNLKKSSKKCKDNSFLFILVFDESKAILFPYLC